MRPISERAVRVEIDGQPRWGRLDRDDVVLDGRHAHPGGRGCVPRARPSRRRSSPFISRTAAGSTSTSHVYLAAAFVLREAADDAQRPPCAAIQKARGSRFLNYEGELAVVIGRRMKGVPIDAVLSYVAGYACANDVGMHDFRHADRGAMLRVKGQDGFLPLGPELVPASEFDPTDYTLRTIVNGEVVQHATADDLIFPVAYQLADLCRLITLEPGDIVLTGTPANSRPMEWATSSRSRSPGSAD